MTAKKTAARNPAAAKTTKAKTADRKKPAAKPAKARPAPKAAAPKPAAPKVEKAIAAKKKPAAAARAKSAPSAAFDPDRRREMIAAAAARRRKTVTVKPALNPIAATKPREASPVEQHRFSVGDEVRVISTSGMWFKHGIDFRVTAALPPQGGKLQYRIKNEQEPYERVVSESQLAAAAAGASA